MQDVNSYINGQIKAGVLAKKYIELAILLSDNNIPGGVIPGSEMLRDIAGSIHHDIESGNNNFMIQFARDFEQLTDFEAAARNCIKAYVVVRNTEIPDYFRKLEAKK
jgi:hypothetical protein